MPIPRRPHFELVSKSPQIVRKPIPAASRKMAPIPPLLFARKTYNHYYNNGGSNGGGIGGGVVAAIIALVVIVFICVYISEYNKGISHLSLFRQNLHLLTTPSQTCPRPNWRPNLQG